jgi:hypothetical protein
VCLSAWNNSAPTGRILVELFIDGINLGSGPGSSVGIATELWAGRFRGSSPGVGRDFLQLSRPAMGPTQPPVQWVPGLSRG